MKTPGALEVDVLLAVAQHDDEAYGLLVREEVSGARGRQYSTGSAGEATVVAFKGRPQTRFVGQPTFGLSSGNTALVGPFGSTAVLTVGVFQDRAGVTYPEEPIPPQTVTAPGEELPAAKAWLQTQRCGSLR